MKRYSLLAILPLTILFLSNVPAKGMISNEELSDKIKGAWTGQTIGCTYGGPTEFRFNGVLIPVI